MPLRLIILLSVILLSSCAKEKKNNLSYQVSPLSLTYYPKVSQQRFTVKNGHSARAIEDLRLLFLPLEVLQGSESIKSQNLSEYFLTWSYSQFFKKQEYQYLYQKLKEGESLEFIIETDRSLESCQVLERVEENIKGALLKKMTPLRNKLIFSFNKIELLKLKEGDLNIICQRKERSLNFPADEMIYGLDKKGRDIAQRDFISNENNIILEDKLLFFLQSTTSIQLKEVPEISFKLNKGSVIEFSLKLFEYKNIIKTEVQEIDFKYLIRRRVSRGGIDIQWGKKRVDEWVSTLVREEKKRLIINELILDQIFIQVRGEKIGIMEIPSISIAFKQEGKVLVGKLKLEEAILGDSIIIGIRPDFINLLPLGMRENSDNLPHLVYLEDKELQRQLKPRMIKETRYTFDFEAYY